VDEKLERFACARAREYRERYPITQRRRRRSSGITSHAGIFNTPSVSLFDYFQRGVGGGDSKMLFLWYSADYCTDPSFTDLPPEQRANPSMAS
jgi:hypothetical protein